MADTNSKSYYTKLLYTFLFAAAFGYVEAMIVVYLREIYYPDGFTFDLYAYRQREFTEAVIGDLARVGIKTNSKADLLAGNFSIFEINLFLPMPLFLLDQTISRPEKYTFIRHAMKTLAAAVKDIPRDQKRKSIFFNMLKAHYRVKKCKLSKNSFISG